MTDRLSDPMPEDRLAEIEADLDARVPARDMEDRHIARELLADVRRLRAEVERLTVYETEAELADEVRRLRAELAEVSATALTVDREAMGYRSVGWTVQYGDRRQDKPGIGGLMSPEWAEHVAQNDPSWRAVEVFVRDPAATEGGEVHVEVHQNADGTWPERPPEADSVTWVGRGPATEGGEG